MQTMCEGEPEFRVETKKMEFADGVTGHLLSIGHHNVGLLQLIHHWFLMNAEYFVNYGFSRILILQSSSSSLSTSTSTSTSTSSGEFR